MSLPGRQRTGVYDLNGLRWRIFASCRLLLSSEDDFSTEGLGDVQALRGLELWLIPEGFQSPGGF